jgi:glycosyltransferase involved in cell wall biosynthesis
MIVKNEASVLRRCLESARPLLNRWLVMDTGSTDGTQALVQELLGELPGQLLERPWVNFGANLTEAMAAAGALTDQPHNLLRLDADMTLRGRPEPLTYDAGLVAIEEAALRYRLPLLVRAGLPWRYVGVTHEYLDCDRPFTRGNVGGLTITHHADGGNRQSKFLRDRELLRNTNLNDPRNVFYLAQTEHCLGNDAAAIRLYDLRASLGGWEEEAWYAAYQSGVLQLRSNPVAGAAALLGAWQRRPWRAEPLHDLAQHYRLHEQDQLAGMLVERALTIPFPDNDVLFIHRDVYAWGLLLEASIARARLGDLRGAAEANEKLGLLPLPPHVKACVHRNHAWCQQAAFTGR